MARPKSPVALSNAERQRRYREARRNGNPAHVAVTETPVTVISEVEVTEMRAVFDYGVTEINFPFQPVTETPVVAVTPCMMCGGLEFLKFKHAGRACIRCHPLPENLRAKYERQLQEAMVYA